MRACVSAAAAAAESGSAATYSATLARPPHARSCANRRGSLSIEHCVTSVRSRDAASDASRAAKAPKATLASGTACGASSGGQSTLHL
eukprot:3457522-Pleurochrysis_carterae.AAC.1